MRGRNWGEWNKREIKCVCERERGEWNKREIQCVCEKERERERKERNGRQN